MLAKWHNRVHAQYTKRAIGQAKEKQRKANTNHPPKTVTPEKVQTDPSTQRNHHQDYNLNRDTLETQSHTKPLH